MKKMLAGVLCAALLLAGCGGPKGGAFAPQKYFTRDFTLFHGDYTVEGRLVCNSYEDIVFTFTHPAALTCVTLRATSAGFENDVGGLADEILLRELPAAAPIKIFAAAVRESVFPAREFTPDGEDCITVIDCGDLPVTVRFSADGALIRIECDAADTAVTVKEPTD